MLQAIKEEISALPIESFAQYYQRFVVSAQDSVLDAIIAKAESEVQDDFTSTTDMIRNINILAEELKGLC